MIKTDIQQLIQPLISDLGYQLWGVEYFSQGKHSLLRIYIDKETGINLEDCETVSRNISALLDVEDPISGNYSLEVSSPGLSRPLFTKDQYLRFLGSEVQLRLTKPMDGRKKLTGTLQSVEEDSMTLAMGNKVYVVLFSQILKANLTGG